MRAFPLALLLSCLIIETAYIVAPYGAPAELAQVSFTTINVTVVMKSQDRFPQQVAHLPDITIDYPPVMDLTMDIPQHAVEAESDIPLPVPPPALAPENNIFRQFKKHQAEIVEIARPGMVWIKTVSGVKAVVAERYAKAFVGFLQDLEDTGYKVKDVGGYVYRRIAGKRQLSKHAFGAAIDVNQDKRNIVSVPMSNKLVSALAAKHGLCSGGDWDNPDLGHFEVCGKPDRGLIRHAKTEKLSKHRSAKVAYRYRQRLPQGQEVSYHDITAYR